MTADADEEEDAAMKARKRLGVPEYDPDAAMVTSLPKVMPLARRLKNCPLAALGQLKHSTVPFSVMQVQLSLVM